MQPWGQQREVEKPKIRQQSVASLPEHEQAAAMNENDRASRVYPSVRVGTCSLHVFEGGGEWSVWLNNEDHDFTGLCVSVASSRQAAIAEAVRTLEAAIDELQKPVLG